MIGAGEYILERKEKSIVFVSGNFNIVHPGHLRLLRFAKGCGDLLVVGVYADSIATNALLNEQLRLESIEPISWVDQCFLLHEPPENFIARFKPEIVVKGKEHEAFYNPEANAVVSYGGKLLFCSGETSFSSIDLLREEFRNSRPNGFDLQPSFLERHKIDASSLSELLDKMKSLKVAVIGDLIIDEYITCEPLGMSREDPTIVVTPIVSDKFIGGAGIVAAHAHGLGAAVEFFSVIGVDANASYAQDELKKFGVSSHLYADESRPTILKQRFRADGKTLLRVSHLRQHAINKDISFQLLHDVQKVIHQGLDLLIFSDFNYGVLHQGLVNEIAQACKKANVMMVADSQSSSQTGDVSRFKHMEFLTPTEHEARLAVRDYESGLVVLAELIRKKAKSKHVLMTLGDEGVLIHGKVSNIKQQWMTDQLRPMNRNPKDVAGAGDSFLTCASMAKAIGYDIWTSTYIGSVAAAFQVSRMGNIPLKSSELLTCFVG
jgi:rfaE bifunctional protein kinase chain/domain